MLCIRPSPLAALLMTATFAACGGRISSEQGAPDAGRGALSSHVPSSSTSDVGIVQCQLQLPAGTVVSSLTYTLTGGSDFARSATQHLASNAAPMFRLTGLPAPDRYSVEVSATAVDGSQVCSSSAMFDVPTNRETVIVLIAQCTGT